MPEASLFQGISAFSFKKMKHNKNTYTLFSIDGELSPYQVSGKKDWQCVKQELINNPLVVFD
jgi:hypothetical protein